MARKRMRTERAGPTAPDPQKKQRKKKAASVRRANDRDIVTDGDEGDDPYVVVSAFVIELTETHVSLLQVGRDRHEPAVVPRSDVGNDDELDKVGFVNAERTLFIRRHHVLANDLTWDE